MPLDSDDEVDTPTTENSKLEEILDIQPRRRNHQPGRWNKRLVGLSIPSYKDSVMCKYMMNMTVTEGVQKLGEIAVDSIRKELQQMCDKNVWEAVHLNSLIITTSSMFCMLYSRW